MKSRNQSSRAEKLDTHNEYLIALKQELTVIKSCKLESAKCFPIALRVISCARKPLICISGSDASLLQWHVSMSSILWCNIKSRPINTPHNHNHFSVAVSDICKPLDLDSHSDVCVEASLAFRDVFYAARQLQNVIAFSSKLHPHLNSSPNWKHTVKQWMFSENVVVVWPNEMLVVNFHYCSHRILPLLT